MLIATCFPTLLLHNVSDLPLMQMQNGHCIKHDFKRQEYIQSINNTEDTLHNFGLTISRTETIFPVFFNVPFHNSLTT